MYEQVEKKKSRAAANSITQKKSSDKQDIRFVDNRTEVVAQKQMEELQFYG